MSIETDLYTTLSNNSGVTALVGARIYPGLAPESIAKPYLVYELVFGERLNTITGVDDATRKRIQINCHASTYASSKSVSDAVEAALEGDGYLELNYDLYSAQTQLFTAIVDWSFLAP
jgi:hypothetical protein